MSGIDTLSDREFDFLSKQYFMHAEKINKLHEERSALMRYSVVATFGYFGWLFLHPEIVADHGRSFWTILPMWFIPFGFNLFGAWRNFYFLASIEKHGGFFDHLCKHGMSCRNHFGEYMERYGKPARWRHPSTMFWGIILMVSLMTGLYGMTGQAITEAP